MGLSVMASGVAAGRPEAAAGPPALVRLGPVQDVKRQAHWDVIGRLQAVRRAVVAAEQPGRIVQIEVDEGDPVTGQQTVLAKIDDVWVQLAAESAQARFHQAQASVAEAQAQLEQAQRDRQYLDELLEAGSAKPREVEDAHTTEQAAEARLSRAEADRLVAQADIDRTQAQLIRLNVLAPFDGKVIRKLTEVGQWVDQGDDVVEMISRGQIDAVVDVSETIINGVTAGQQVQVQIEPLDLVVRGHVVLVNPQGSDAAGTFRVRIRLDDMDGRLKPAMSVVVNIPLDRQMQVLTVPYDAVQQSTSGAVVWADDNGAALPIPVEVLFDDGDRLAIKQISDDDPAAQQRLVVGMSVVIEGAERLFPGRPLKVAQPTDPG